MKIWSMRATTIYCASDIAYKIGEFLRKGFVLQEILNFWEIVYSQNKFWNFHALVVNLSHSWKCWIYQ